MNELSKWGNGSLANTRPSREVRAATRQVMEETQIAGLKVDALTALYGKAMDRVTDLDNHRQALAHNNPELNSVLIRLELGYVASVEKMLRSHDNPFGV